MGYLREVDEGKRLLDNSRETIFYQITSSFDSLLWSLHAINLIFEKVSLSVSIVLEDLPSRINHCHIQKK